MAGGQGGERSVKVIVGSEIIKASRKLSPFWAPSEVCQ